YVVVSADHTGNTVWELIRDGFDDGATVVSSSKRLDDIYFVLKQFLAKNELESDFFFETIDEKKIGNSGHSFGGWTAATTACLDQRIRVSVPQSPVLGLAEVYGCRLSEYPVPIMVMSGTKDNTVTWKEQYCDYNATLTAEKYLYELADGGHYTFSDICDLDLVALAAEFDFGPAEEALQDGCSTTDNVPWHDAQTTINHYSTAFLNYHLRNSKDSQNYLVEIEQVPFDTVTFHSGQLPDWPEGGCTEN
ncbi:MAG: hypothetical protein JRJ87_20375, partial [Deltaproteobacteria bacterium]|nr:hypothetical protein [Deltaproteobacteria bacterium]